MNISGQLLANADYYQRFYRYKSPLSLTEALGSHVEFPATDQALFWVTHGAVRWPEATTPPAAATLQSAFKEGVEDHATNNRTDSPTQTRTTEYGREWDILTPGAYHERWRLTSIRNGHYLHMVGIAVWADHQPALAHIDTLAQLSHIRTWGPGLARPLEDEDPPDHAAKQHTQTERVE